jgi:hypothetical protein
MTVFHEGTISPNFRLQVAMTHRLREAIRFQDRLNASRSGTVGAWTARKMQRRRVRFSA